MPRPVVIKEPAEHIAQLTRIVREVEKNPRYKPPRKKKIVAVIGQAIKNFQEEL